VQERKREGERTEGEGKKGKGREGEKCAVMGRKKRDGWMDGL